jgi:predicted transposase YdaD
MALRFDATLKDLVQNHPADWLAILGEPPSASVSVLTPDLSTLTAFADIVLRVGDTLFHLDFQSGADAELPRRILLYNVLLFDRYALPVHSAVVLLHPRANRSDLTGMVAYEARPGRGGLTFRFEVVRLWEVPVATLLQSGLGTLPLAPLGHMPEGATVEEALPGVIERLVERIQAEAPPRQAAALLTAAFVLTGLRIAQDRAVQLFQGVRAMRESSTYQYILDEGRAEGSTQEARRILLRVGRKRFGGADEAVQAALQAIADLERLERMSERLLDVTTWGELLETP